MSDADQIREEQIQAVERSVNRLEGFVGAIVVMLLVTGVMLIGHAMAVGNDCPAPIYQSVQAEFRLFPADPFEIGAGERLYLLKPDAILDAIREAEGAPSYGVMVLAKRYNGHQNVPPSIGREAAAKLVHKTYRRWRAQGRPGDFLAYLHRVYAPRGASNDPNGLNNHWLKNINRHLGKVARVEGTEASR